MLWIMSLWQIHEMVARRQQLLLAVGFKIVQFSKQKQLGIGRYQNDQVFEIFKLKASI